MYDIIIKNGTVIDGSGRPMYRADLAVSEGRIAAIGDVGAAGAERVIDATGQYVCPGFIDVNNHSDTYWQLLANPELESLLYQGVTTVIGGNSGSSLAPLTDPKIIRSIQKWTDVEKINFNWLSMEEFLNEIEKRRPAVNFATLVGHGTMRRGVMYDRTRTITPEEIRMMEQMLERSFEEGAIGLSTGLKYTHAAGAGMRELSTLAKIVASFDGVYATYVRDEGEGLVKSVEETIAIARNTGVKLHISHLKAVGKKNWPLMDEVFNHIEAAALNDVRISFDVYPYTTTGSVLYTFLPEWVTNEGRKMMLARLRDPGVRSTVIRDMQKKDIDYSEIVIASSDLSKMLSRRKISDLALLYGKSPEETVLDFLIASNGRAIVSIEALSEKNIAKAIQHPFSIISSNGVGYNIQHADTGELVHPRNFGTFPKVLSEYVREKKELSWEEAIHKMSGKPAEKFGLQKRGVLLQKYIADIVVFDPEKITDKATMEDPYQYAVGMRYVFVNGTMVLEDGVLHTGKRSGVVLQRKKNWFSW
ncbi:MAG: D-aminoacylase [Candidatus Moranbacteria bacterium]|nr:D-aminoacylase [Candidatus Moranbacteria bacterium]